MLNLSLKANKLKSRQIYHLTLKKGQLLMQKLIFKDGNLCIFNKKIKLTICHSLLREK